MQNLLSDALLAWTKTNTPPKACRQCVVIASKKATPKKGAIYHIDRLKIKPAD